MAGQRLHTVLDRLEGVEHRVVVVPAGHLRPLADEISGCSPGRLTGVGCRNAARPDTTSYLAVVLSRRSSPKGLWYTCTSRKRIVFCLPFGSVSVTSSPSSTSASTAKVIPCSLLKSTAWMSNSVTVPSPATRRSFIFAVYVMRKHPSILPAAADTTRRVNWRVRLVP